MLRDIHNLKTVLLTIHFIAGFWTACVCKYAQVYMIYVLFA